MEKTKAFLEAHYKRYILTICLLWFLMFFLPWDWQIGGVSVYYFVMKNSLWFWSFIHPILRAD